MTMEYTDWSLNLFLPKNSLDIGVIFLRAPAGVQGSGVEVDVVDDEAKTGGHRVQLVLAQVNMKNSVYGGFWHKNSCTHYSSCTSLEHLRFLQYNLCKQAIVTLDLKGVWACRQIIPIILHSVLLEASFLLQKIIFVRPFVCSTRICCACSRSAWSTPTNFYHDHHQSSSTWFRFFIL